MSLFGKKQVVSPRGEESLRPQDLEALEKIIQRDPDVAKRRNAVEAVIETVRTYRGGLDVIRELIRHGHTTAGASGQHSPDVLKEAEKLVQGIRRASFALMPGTADKDALVRTRAYAGLAGAVASQVVFRVEVVPDAVGGDRRLAQMVYAAIGGCLTEGMKDTEASVRVAAASALGEYVKSWAKAPGEARQAVGTLVDHLEDSDPDVREAGRLALRHGLESFPQDALARLVAEEEIWKRAAEAAQAPLEGSSPGEGPNSTEAVGSLLAIYTANPEGFAPGYGNPTAREQVRRIGEALNLSGGMTLMLGIHAEFAGRCQIPGAARNLEHTWDGIGDWRG
jgi:HEAT repeat protein